MLHGQQEAAARSCLLPCASKLYQTGLPLLRLLSLFCDGMPGSMCASQLVMQLLCEASCCGAIAEIKLGLMGALPLAGLAGPEQRVAEQVPQCITAGIPEAPQQSRGTAGGASAQLVPGQFHLPEPQWLHHCPEAAQGGSSHLIPVRGSLSVPCSTGMRCNTRPVARNDGPWWFCSNCLDAPLSRLQQRPCSRVCPALKEGCF